MPFQTAFLCSDLYLGHFDVDMSVFSEETRSVRRSNVVQFEKFCEKLKWAIQVYRIRAVANRGPALVAMGDGKLKAVTAELMLKFRENVAIDWNSKQSAQAGIRATAKTLLARHGYPPGYSDEAIEPSSNRAKYSLKRGHRKQPHSRPDVAVK
ncbi:MAG: type I restriction enzyme endonuclease domain-containing protein [Acidimicrobiia bacterium]